MGDWQACQAVHISSGRLSLDHVDVLGINDALVPLGLTAASGRWSCTCSCVHATLRLRRPVHVLGQLMGDVGQSLLGMLQPPGPL